jgi:heat shock protein HslJ
MSRRSLSAVAAVITISVSLAACVSTTKSSSSGPSVMGKTYVSTRVTGHTMPAGTKVTVTFGTDGNLSANAGCNSMSGTFSVDNGRLAVGELAMTEMGCSPPARQAQDGWLAAELGARPELVLSGTTLRLTAGATVIEFAEQ